MTECLEVFAATEVLKMCVRNNEVGSEHGGGDLATIRAVANEGFDKSWGHRRLKMFSTNVARKEKTMPQPI